MLDDFAEIMRRKFGSRANLGETFGDQLEALDIIVHLLKERVVRVRLLQHFAPGHQGGDRRSKLMGRFAGEADPHPVLLSTLGGKQSQNTHEDKEAHHAQLHIRIDGKPAQHDRLLIEDVDMVLDSAPLRRAIHAHRLAVALHVSHSDVEHSQGILAVGLRGEIAGGKDIPLLVGDDNGDGVVAVDDLQNQTQVRRFIRHRQ